MTAPPAPVQAGGMDWRLRETGPRDGPALLLLHGFPETGRCWSRVAPIMAQAGWRVLAPDLPGYGASSPLPASPTPGRLADAVIALADAAGVGRFVLAGHDWGGLIGWAVAARHPRRLRHLAVLSAPHPDAFGRFLRRHPGQWRRSAYIAAFQLPALPERVLRAGDHALLCRGFPASGYDAADLAAYRAAWRRPGALTAMLRYYRALGGASPLGRIAVPATILWGARDAYLDPRLAPASAAWCDAARTAVAPARGHWLPREAPAWVADRLHHALPAP